MKLAITGGTGFVGSHLIDAALAADHRVSALTRGPQRPRSGVTWVSGDLGDPAAIKQLVDSADAVIHVAGLLSAKDEAAFDEANVAGTLTMLAAAKIRTAVMLVYPALASRRRRRPSSLGDLGTPGSRLSRGSTVSIKVPLVSITPVGPAVAIWRSRRRSGANADTSADAPKSISTVDVGVWR